MKGKMAIIGDGDSTQIFKACGLDTFNSNSVNQCKSILKDIKNNYKIIFITDNYAKELDSFLEEYDNDIYPIIVSLPSKNGNNGYGMDLIKKEMERALGIDILFND